MTITMNDTQLKTIGNIENFLKASQEITFQYQNRSEAYAWIQKTVSKFKYVSLNKFEKGIIKQYIKHMTKYSRAQITRLLSLYQHTGSIEEPDYQRHCFVKKYSDDDLRLLAQTDEIHGFPNGCAIKCRLHILALKDKKYENIAKISVAHIYKLRKSKRYQRMTKHFEKTKSVKSPIGRRVKPQPNGQPGYIRVDTVHQGDRNGIKGIYHVNTIDEVTQYEFIAVTPAITQNILIPILRQLLDLYPFKILGFHCDNGSEYINKYVVALLNELLINNMTKSRPRHSNDNAIVESKNGSIIRTWIGYGFIDKQFAKNLNEFYFGCFNEYLNFHRPCAFASIKELPDGKIKKVYKQEDYATPYDKLKSLPNAEKYLKKGVSFKKLEKKFLVRNCNEHGEIVQQQRQKLFNKIFALNNSSSGSLLN